MNLGLLTRRSFCVAALPFGIQAQRPAQWFDIVVERGIGEDWKPIVPGLILDPGDLVRFRFTTNLDGYLYVVCRGTSGADSLLFPRLETGRNNRVEAGVEQYVPATEARFRVAGPPGHDIVYWLMSPVPLDGGAAAILEKGGVPTRRAAPKLVPRCDDSILRARGQCVDSSAGPRGGRSRDLVIIQRDERTSVSTPSALRGPMIYEFRLAHR